MEADRPRDLRVLVADEQRTYIEPLTRALEELGHEVIATEIDPAEVSTSTKEHQPDVAIVALHDDTEHALELITEVANETLCPVMAMVEGANTEFVTRAAERGIFAHLDSPDHDELLGAISVALKRFDEYKRLQTAFARRAKIERAKGVLMERHGIGEEEAFARLRRESRSSRRRLIDLVEEELGEGARQPFS